MALTLEHLKKERRIIRTRVTKFETLLNEINNETILYTLDLEGRLSRHNELWQAFNEVQTKIEELTPDDTAKHESDRSTFEDRFYAISGTAKHYIKKMNSLTAMSSAQSTSSNDFNVNQDLIQNLRTINQNPGQSPSQISSYFQLPKLQTPIFRGTFDTWLEFSDSFKAMCHDNQDIPTINKFMYLKACVQGDARDIIDSLETTAANYAIAWELLQKRYDNRQFIIESHIKSLVEIPTVSREFSVRMLLDNIQKRIRALKALGQPVDQWDSLLIFLIKEKMNYYLRDKWNERIGSSKIPTMKDMMSFLEDRALFESAQSAQKPTQPHKLATKNSTRHQLNTRPSQTSMTTTVSKDGTFKPKCLLCSEEHFLWACKKFSDMSAQHRYDFVKGASICHNCFNTNHSTRECRKEPCRICKKRHNSLLHFNLKTQEQDSSNNPSSQAILVGCQLQSYSQIVLGTALVEILDNNGQYRLCRALLDSCSQCNSITDKFASALGLKKNRIDIQLNGVDNLKTNIKYTTSTKIKSRVNDLTLKMSFLVFNEISSRMPSMTLDRNLFKIPDNVSLADPEFHRPADVDILIGAEFYYDLLGSGKIRLPGQSAVLQQTDLGWIVAGHYAPPRSSSIDPMEVSCNLTRFQDLPILWELESENPSKVRSREEKACESHYLENTTRDDSNRYVVKLPFNDKKESLGDSRNTAFQRFYALERKFEKSPTFKAQYSNCIQSYLDEKHMSLVPSQSAADNGYFLPHHAVVKESSLTTKTRVVFDGSAKTSTGISLNDTFMIGPTIQEDLFSIIARFRTYLYAMTADIEQMYRQVRVAPEDSSFQKILWRQEPSEPIKIYALNRVTFGTACAPFLAIRTLHKLADDEHESHPIASQVLKRDFYVDDLLTGANSLQNALELRNELITLLSKGGFNLRKWASNHSILSTDLSNEIASTYKSLDPTETVKTLGIHWDAKNDSIFYTVNLSNSKEPITKRTILSQTAKLFDPLGLLGPVIVSAKIMIQQLWKCKLTWDTPVPVEVQDFWLQYKNELPLLNNLRFDRCIMISNSTEVQLHGFCDASEKAYGACLYLRSSNTLGNHYCALICSKSRVAPLKTTSLPRLELCAAVLLAKLYSVTVKSLQVNLSKIYFWSDSTIALNWINTPPHTLKTFEANRVAEIQEKTEGHEWRHVPTHNNPADLISRGQGPQEFLNNEFWTHGPKWLKEREDIWPQLNIKGVKRLKVRENQQINSLKITLSEMNLLERVSNFKKLQSIIAYCFRFFDNLKNKDKSKRLTGRLSPSELDKALKIIVKLIQAEAFPKELRALSHNEGVDPKSPLIRLNPFLDHGIIKVGGRLIHANIPDSKKHPIVLPKNHHITKIIIRDEHIKLCHAGSHATLYTVRETFWPIDGRNMTRNIIRKCITCFRAKPRETNYLMGNLPKDRVSFIRPFEHVGVDYCGPFFVKEHRHRNRTKVKTYVAIFVCLATKAVHLELASDLTTDAFIACLSRFFSRRGLSSSISSDNATNFIGANNELKDLYKQIESLEQNDKVQNCLSKKGITWHFIPPRAPHFGGLWEAAVRSFKHHFTRVTGNSLLTYEQLHTYVTEIEAILNSRPLTPLSPDPNDLLPLTPGHFLIGKSMTSFPSKDVCNIPANRLNCWQLAQQMRQHFWNRWYKEYLNELISRSKWQFTTDQSMIKLGTLVVIKEDNLPPMMWKLGRITAIHPGKDGVIRSVSLRTTSGVYKRSLRSVYPLPIDN